MASITIELSDINELLLQMVQKDYVVSKEDETDQKFLQTCLALWRADYHCHVLDNTDGSLCDTYPSKIIIPQYELHSSLVKQEINFPLKSNYTNGAGEAPCKVEENGHCNENKCKSEEIPDGNLLEEASSNGNGNLPEWILGKNLGNLRNDWNNMRRVMAYSSFARYRERFVVPVMLYCDKYICRSGTLATWTTTTAKCLTQYEFDRRFEGAREVDIRILKEFKVSSIVDFMVEKKKVVCSYISISSSEKVDKENRYKDFNIYSLPYPGCEFFTHFVKNSHNSEGLFYQWRSYDDAQLSIPHSKNGSHSKICDNWQEYRKWDLRTITRRYLHLVKSCITGNSEDTGYLIHCISGWDRTPLFISLLRLLLWADGHVHNSLSPIQMLYFTLAYDWFLFGHTLKTRLANDEHILYFTFEFLFYLMNEESEVNEEAEETEEEPTAEDQSGGGSDIGTPTSFGSATSLASNSSQAASQSTLVAPSKTSRKKDHLSWPFSKDSQFTFEGIKDTPGDTNSAPQVKISQACKTSTNGGVDEIDAGCPSNGTGTASVYTDSCRERPSLNNRVAAVRSPKKSPKAAYSRKLLQTAMLSDATNSNGASTSDGNMSQKLSNLNKKGKLSSFMKELSSKKRKNSSKFNTSNESIELENTGESKVDPRADSPLQSGRSSTKSVPVPIPAGCLNRSRQDSTGSSVGSWQLIAKESSGSIDSSKLSLFELVEATNTITEEIVPGSVGSDQSIEIFSAAQRKKKLKEVSCLFFKIYGDNYQINKKKSFFNLNLPFVASKIGLGSWFGY